MNKWLKRTLKILGWVVGIPVAGLNARMKPGLSFLVSAGVT